MNDFPNHPTIANMERSGYPDGREPPRPHCPICGAEVDTIYTDGANVQGCPECILTVDAWDEPQCFPEEEL